jgi:uncharacterized repeat protein (TIGR04138 family)
MQEVSFDETLDRIVAEDPRYKREAYHFLREALEYTQKSASKGPRRRMRHVSGQELLAGIRAYALEQFGPMAKLVLEEWGVCCCEDCGELVFNLIGKGWLAKTKSDTRADFQNGYDFEEAFRKPFLPKSKQTAPPAPAAKAQGSIS